MTVIYKAYVALPTGSLIDAKWNALVGKGYTGSMSDMTLAWLQANGATSGHISDAWLEMLEAKGGSGQRNDMWYDLLGTMGYTGALPDRELQFWLDGGDPPPPTGAGEHTPDGLQEALAMEGWTVILAGELFEVTDLGYTFTWSEALNDAYTTEPPAPIRADIDQYFGR
jgi:hypothetical protein